MNFGYIYIICDPANNLYKIGVTRDIKSNRLKKLQTGNPTELHICKTYYCQYPFRVETLLHNHFKSKNILNEWFALDMNDYIEFDNIINQKIELIKSLSDNPFFMKNIK